MATNFTALSSGGGGGGGLTNDEEEDEMSVPDDWGHRLEEEEQSSSDSDSTSGVTDTGGLDDELSSGGDPGGSSGSTDGGDEIVKSPSGTCVNSVTGEVVDCETGEPLESPADAGDNGGDRPEPGDPDWPQASVVPAGSLSIVKNVAPGEALSPRIHARGDGPVGKTADATYRVEVPKAGLSKSITVTINGGKNRWVELDGLGSISEPGQYEAILYGDGEQLDSVTYNVGDTGEFTNTSTTFEEAQAQSGDSSTSGSTTSDDSSAPSPTGSTDPAQPSSGAPEDGQVGGTGPPARPSESSPLPGGIDLGLDTDQLLLGVVALVAVAMVVRA